MEPTTEERRSQWREASAVGLAFAVMMSILLSAAVLLVIGGWPLFNAAALPPSAPSANGLVAE
jgi:hypothetical protein